MCCCGDTPTQTRFTVDGKLETSPDNGVTWENGDNIDPRYTSTEFPPMIGDDGDEKRCNAAASAAKVIEDDIIQKLVETNLGIALFTLIAGILALLLSGGALAPLVMTLVGAALRVGGSAVEAAFTVEVWDTFKCIVYCNIEDDASFTDAGWLLTKQQVRLQLSGIAAELLENTVNAFGVVGMTNAARSSRAEDSDCSDCTDCGGGCAAAVTITVGTMIEETDEYLIVESDTFNPGSGTVMAVVIVLPEGCCSISSPEEMTGYEVDTPFYHSHRCNGSVLSNYWVEPECLQDVSIYKAGAPTFRIKFTFNGECF